MVFPKKRHFGMYFEPVIVNGANRNDFQGEKGNLKGEKNAGRKRCSERKGDNDVREFWDTNGSCSGE